MSETKTIDTLLADIYSLLSRGGHKISEDNLKVFVDTVVISVKDAIECENNLDPKAQLRLSKTGTPPRKIWFEHNYEKKGQKSSADPLAEGPNLMRFLVGHVTESLLLLLAKEAGHSVSHEQREVILDDVVGHLDAVIDGHTVDVKTASQFAYDKFKTGDIVWGKDPFGYIPQLSAYKTALVDGGVAVKDTSYFWAYNKSNSEMTLVPVEDRHLVDPKKLLQEQKEAITKSEPPEELCYPEEASGKSGNMAINKNCSFCPFKFECFRDANKGDGLRVFKYSKGLEYLTKVVKTPEVEELTHQK